MQQQNERLVSHCEGLEHQKAILIAQVRALSVHMPTWPHLPACFPASFGEPSIYLL
jgi:hypothetical protein